MTAPSSRTAVAAVIFDLDGVIVDSEPWWHAVRVEWAAGLDRTWTEADSRACMGLSSRQWSVEMQARLGLDMPLEAVVDAIVGALVERYHRSPAPRIPGAVEAVRRIAGALPVAIASGSHAAVIDAALRAVGIADLFGAVVSADDVALGKPAPDVFLEAARRLGVDPASCLVVEDALNGTLAGKAAGMTVVLVPNPSFPAGGGDRRPCRHGRRPSRRPRPAGAGPVSDPLVPGMRPRRFPYWFVTIGIRIIVGAYLRVRAEGCERLPDGPAILCFSHQSWLDPFVLVAALPARPDLRFFGPKEADMSVGARNRLITWSGRAVPFNPERTNLLTATRSVDAVLKTGARLAIAPEGRIHAGERTLLPLNEGVAYFALRSGVPIVPIALVGMGWVRLGRTVRVRIGDPIMPAARPTRDAVAELTTAVEVALRDLVKDALDQPAPGPVGRWITELFNDWPEGVRPPVEHE